MNRALWKKAICEAQGLLLACAAPMFAFCWLRVWLTTLWDASQFEAILRHLPPLFERSIPVPLDQIASYPGRIALAYDAPPVVLIITVWAISRGSDCVSGELDRGTMELLLAQPVSRLRILLTQATVTIGGTVLLALVAWGGTATGIATTTVEEPPEQPKITLPLGPFAWDIPLPTKQRETRRVPMSQKVETRLFLPAAINLLALGVFLAGLATFMSSWDRFRWRTIGIVMGIYVVELIVKVVGVSAPDWSWLTRLTFFTAFEPQKFVHVAVREPQNLWSLLLWDSEGRWTDLGPLGYDAVLMGLGLAAYLAATAIFCRRDLPAPL